MGPAPGSVAAVAALLLLGSALAVPVPATAAAPQEALAPVKVALDALPEVVASAMRESQEQLISDRAQHRIDLVYAYVQGFAALPAGDGALADPATRDAYTWTEQVVETFLTLPAQFDASETGGSLCRSYGNNGTAEQVQRAVDFGTRGATTMAALRGELARLAANVPAGIDRTPFDEALALIDGWQATEGKSIQDCVATLHASAPPSRLQAVVVPPTTYPTGRARILGTVAGVSQVTATVAGFGSAGTGLQATPVNGTFSLPFTVPRSASLGPHAIAVTAGSLHADLVLTVQKADVSLRLQAPARVVANTTFTVQASVTSPAGHHEVDRVPVRLSWRSTDSSLALANGTAQSRLPAGPPASLHLVATYAGSDILRSTTADVPVLVFVPGGANDPYASSRGPAPAAHGLALSWFWWLLVLVGALLVALGLFMMPVVIHRLRGARGQALRGDPAPPRWPGATTFVAAVAALFDLLRRRHLAPPGQTFREWIGQHGGPAVIADRFDAVRYGDQAEDETLRKTGLDWAQRAWDRWRSR